MVANRRRTAIILSSITAALALAGTAPAAATASGRVYAYRLGVLGLERYGNGVQAVCAESNAVIPNTLLRPVSANTNNLFRTATENEEFNVTLNVGTKLVATGPFASLVTSVCAMNELLSGTRTGEASPGVFTWRLSKPARSVAAILSHPATEAVMNTGGE
jgi:hypothetical protein